MNKFLFLCSIIILVNVCYAGQNEKAVVILDYDAKTDSIESWQDVKSKKMSVSVRIKDAIDLDGFSFLLKYDSRKLRYNEYNPKGEGFEGKLFLESNGGKAGPVLLEEKIEAISIASSLIGKNKKVAPTGDGILAIFIFERIDYEPCELILQNVELVDSDLNMDKK